MIEDPLPAGLSIAAHIRTAAREGIPIVVIRRGDETRGAIFLKINMLDGTARVLAQVRMGDELIWNPITREDPLPESEADRCLERQAEIDPDSWLIEIEDRQGRHWFPGRVVKL